jgi:hypothetical protein
MFWRPQPVEYRSGRVKSREKCQRRAPNALRDVRPHNLGVVTSTCPYPRVDHGANLGGSACRIETDAA